MSIVNNPEEPYGGEFRLELRESLVITERSAGCSFETLSSLFVDDGGRMFVLDDKNCRILKFDPARKLLLKIGKRDQGPEELEYSERFLIAAVGNPINSDGQRLHFFEPDGRYRRSLTMDHRVHELLLADDDGRPDL